MTDETPGPDTSYADACAALGRAYDSYEYTVKHGPKLPALTPAAMHDCGTTLLMEETEVWQLVGNTLNGALTAVVLPEARVLPAETVGALREALERTLTALKGLTDLRVTVALQDPTWNEPEPPAYVMLLDGVSSVTVRHAREFAQEFRADEIRPGDVLSESWRVVKHTAYMKADGAKASAVELAFKDGTETPYAAGEKLMAYRPE